MEDIIARYYIDQATSGQGSFYSGPIYQRGSGYFQRGAGIGSFLGGLYRRLVPLLKKGTAMIGREVLNSGANFVNDITHNVHPRDAAKRRVKEVIHSVIDKTMDGNGYKRRPARIKTQFNGALQLSNTKKLTLKRKSSLKHKSPQRKKRVKTRDIFSS